MYEKIGNYVYKPIPIGKGSYSFVYHGKHIHTNQEVAIKKINISLSDKNIVQNIKSEIAIMKTLTHPNIVKLYEEIYDEYNNIYLIMEYCKGGNLSEFLNNKPLKEKYVLKFMKQIADATKYLYFHNIIHRDIKPHNILITSNDHIKLTDFGFAKSFQSGEEKLNQTICGSPIYMAPEIIKSNYYTIKTDLWSIGIILYEMIIGKKPFKARTHLELIHKIDTTPVLIPIAIMISNECRDLIERLLQRNPDKRIGWKEFFEHKWFKKDLENDILDELIIDFDYLNMNTENDYIHIDEKEEDIEEKEENIKEKENLYENQKVTENNQSLPINIPNKPQEESNMFNTPLLFSPNVDNSYIAVCSNMTGEKYEEGILTDSKRFSTERTISESLLDYMSDTVNYVKSYYWR